MKDNNEQTVTISYVIVDGRDDDTLADSGLETALDGERLFYKYFIL